MSKYEYLMTMAEMKDNLSVELEENGYHELSRSAKRKADKFRKSALNLPLLDASSAYDNN